MSTIEQAEAERVKADKLLVETLESYLDPEHNYCEAEKIDLLIAIIADATETLRRAVHERELRRMKRVMTPTKAMATRS